MANKHGKAKPQGGGKIKVAGKAEEQLIEEIERLRQEVSELRREETELKRAETALREDEERFRDIAETTLEWLWEVDANGKYTYASPVSEKILGYKPGEILKKHFYDLFHPDDREELKKAAFETFAQKQPFREFINRNIHKNGKTVWLLTSGVPVLDEKGKLLGYRGVDIDITERKQAEIVLEESEEKYRTQFEQAMDAIVIADAETGMVIDCNRAACKLVGRRKSEIVGQHQQILHPPQEKNGDVSRTFKQHRGEKEGKTLETQVITKKGEIKNVAIKANIIEFRGKKTLQGIFWDITERKQAEEKLRESEEKYRTILESVVEGYYEVDLAGNFTIVNDAICRNLGYSRDELIGMNNRDYMDKETAKKVLERYVEVYTTGQPARGFEFEVTRKDGAKLVTSSSVSLITDSQGQLTGFRGLVRDVTAEKQTEEMLRQSENKYRTILESIEHGYFEVDIRGNFTFFNDSMCQILGYTRDEMIGMNNRQYTDKKNARKVYQTFNKVYTTGESAQGFDWEFIRKDGTKRIVEAPVSLIRDAEAKPIGFRGIVRDITERRKAEIERKTLEQRAQVASRLSTVGEMASGILHEMNNPLTSIIGFAHLLAQQDLPEDAKEYARIINNDGQRVATIAGRLLNFARYQKPEIVYADINQVIENTLQLQAYEMEAANIKVTTKLDPDQPQTMADVGQLQQVFLNIILNAKTEMRSAHGEGKLLVKTETIDNIIRISFKDNGPGIPQKNLERIFEPFFTTRELGKGTGLGLSICHEIIANHNGQIYAESRSGKGATFTIELPVVARQRRTTQAGSAIDKPQRLARVRR